MPRTQLPDELAAMLMAPNPSVVATVRPDGELHTAATWYEFLDDGRILLNMDATRMRLRHLRAAPRVAMTIFAGGDWYSHISIAGQVEEFRDDIDLTDIDRLALRYKGTQYPDRHRESISAIIKISRWHAWKTPLLPHET